MPRQTLASLDLARYARLANRSLPVGGTLAVCDASGTLVWPTSTTHKDDTARELSVHLREHGSFWKPEDTNVQDYKIDGQSRLYYSALLGAGKLNIGGVLFLLKSELSSSNSPAQDIDNLVRTTLADISICIKTEYELTAELDAMAGELALRYEELNLVYDTDDQNLQNIDPREALKDLVKHCASHLDVELAALLCPDRRANVYHVTISENAESLHQMLAQTRVDLYRWMRAHKQSIILNDISDPLRSYVCPALPYKLLSCPVLEASGGVCGVLVTLKSNRKSDFTNSDRKLMEVVAKKTAKILQTNYDALTGLENRHGFEGHVEQALWSAQHEGTKHCIVNLDIDQLKLINESVDRNAGDEVLRQVGHFIRRTVRDDDTVARIGDDEFAALLENCSLQDGQRIAEKLRDLICQPYTTNAGHSLEISASIGVAPITAESKSVSERIRAAELAREAAAELGRNQVQVYQQGDENLLRRQDEIQLVGTIQHALRENRFRLYLQSIVPLGGPFMHHYEVLLRMLDDQDCVVAPGLFLPAAERYQLMPYIDRWVIHQVFATIKQHQAELTEVPPVWAINLSGQSLSDESFLSFVLEELDQHGIEPEWICFEITETAAIAALSRAKHFIDTLKTKGCSFALDDFGTGLSSYAYLRNLPVDYLKIDGTFVKEIVKDPIAAEMVDSINQIGHLMGIKTVAEFVESNEIKEKLFRMGIDYGQGYAIHKPQPLAEVLKELCASDNPSSQPTPAKRTA